jgi:hypothetical protein
MAKKYTPVSAAQDVDGYGLAPIQLKAHPFQPHKPGGGFELPIRKESAMSKFSILAGLHRKQISYEEFMARHEEAGSITDLEPGAVGGSANTMAQILAPSWMRSLPPVMQELKRHPFFRLLAAAARENCPDAYNIQLYVWLCRMGVVPPQGVFKDPRGKRGRPRERRTAIIYEKWMETGCPSLGGKKLAFAIYGPEFTKASSADRKKMVDRCRRAVERGIAQLRPNSESIKS